VSLLVLPPFVLSDRQSGMTYAPLTADTGVLKRYFSATRVVFFPCHPTVPCFPSLPTNNGPFFFDSAFRGIVSFFLSARRFFFGTAGFHFPPAKKIFTAPTSFVAAGSFSRFAAGQRFFTTRSFFPQFPGPVTHYDGVVASVTPLLPFSARACLFRLFYSHFPHPNSFRSLKRFFFFPRLSTALWIIISPPPPSRITPLQPYPPPFST